MGIVGGVREVDSEEAKSGCHLLIGGNCDQERVGVT